MAWNQYLIDEQIEAVQHGMGSARILAGPGTGKTKTLIHRVAYLLEEFETPPEQILVLTFTRAAAKELDIRLTEHLDNPNKDLPWVNTLHAYAYRTLLHYPAQSGFSDAYRIADDYEETNIIYAEIGWIIGKSKKEIKPAMSAYATRWNTLNDEHPDWQNIDFRIEFETALKSLGQFYKFKLRAELVYELWNFFEGNPLIGQSMGIKHLLVDEYQDLNHCDQSVIAQLESFGAELFIVGDENQSIYSFRHADRSGILTFTNTRPDSKSYKLIVCHRCPENIIKLATSLIGWDTTRIKRELVPDSSSKQGDVVSLQFRDHEEEAKGIAIICASYISTGLVEPKDISILLSRKKLKKYILIELGKLQLRFTDLVPVWPLGEDEDHEDHEGRLVYCKLRLLHNRRDGLALRTYLQLQIGVAEATIRSIRDFCLSNELDLWDGLLIISQDHKQIPRHGLKIKRIFDLLKLELDEGCA